MREGGRSSELSNATQLVESSAPRHAGRQPGAATEKKLSSIDKRRTVLNVEFTMPSFDRNPVWDWVAAGFVIIVMLVLLWAVCRKILKGIDEETDARIKGRPWPPKKIKRRRRGFGGWGSNDVGEDIEGGDADGGVEGGCDGGSDCGGDGGGCDE